MTTEDSLLASRSFHGQPSAEPKQTAGQYYYYMYLTGITNTYNAIIKLVIMKQTMPTHVDSASEVFSMPTCILQLT